MISDILIESSEEISRYMRQYPDVYKDAEPELKNLLKHMDNIFNLLNKMKT